MTFAWPWMLLSLAGVPLLVLGYQRLLRRRAARRTELAALGLVSPGAVSSGWRRHVSPALFIAALAVLMLSLARPAATIPQPRREGTVILAFDVSASMAATDVLPSRIEAAKSAARAFVQRQPATVRVGVVAFSTSGLITQQATSDRTRVLDAINRLTPDGGTALARGLQTSLSAIAGKTVLLDDPSNSVEPPGQDLGYHGSAAVILLSDGENTAEPDPLAVAQLASAAGVRVYPIGLGRPEGTVLEINGFQVATALDEVLLRNIAQTTDGRYFAAADQAQLASVYGSIDLAWTVESKHVEVTGLLAAAAALLLIVGVGLSLAWFGRVV
ncbi:MAG: Ca-activated chloride channel [Frankiaceae bacterium]|jgi:Ca-activated chloride channel family protein|nr:Ca-activated chloride channel [Frankiaceae bacterium]